MTQGLVHHLCTHCKQNVSVAQDALHHADEHDVPEGFDGSLDPEKPSRCLGSSRPTQRTVAPAQEFVEKAETTFATIPR